MAVDKLNLLVSTLDKSEIRQLRRLLMSPFFTRRTDLPALFECLSQRKWVEKPMPEAQELFSATYPEEPYDDMKLRGTKSDLLGLIEEFLLIDHHRKAAVDNRLLLANIYRRRGLKKHFESCMKKTDALLLKSEIRNVDYFSKVHEHQVLRMQFQTETRRTGELNLQEISDSIDILYLMKKLRHACTQLTHQAVYKKTYDYGLLPDLLEKIETGGFLKYPAVATYYYCYRFLTEEYNLGRFIQFRTQIQENKSLFPEQEHKDLYLVAINYCIKQVNAGNQPFFRQVWELYQEGLDSNFLIEDGRISSFTFNNIVAISIQLKEYQWVENFLETFQEKLATKNRTNVVNFNQARLEFAKGNLEKALVLLQNSEYQDLINNLISKNLLMKIYFELEEFDLLESHLDSLSKFILRRDMSDFHRKNYLNIIRFVRKLMSLQTYDKSKSKALKDEIMNEETLSEREWLLSKIKV